MKTREPKTEEQIERWIMTYCTRCRDEHPEGRCPRALPPAVRALLPATPMAGGSDAEPLTVARGREICDAATNCLHPWEYLRPSIPGVVCQKCESTFMWAKAGFLIWVSAHQRMDELADSIERLDNAMSLLGLEPCMKCGTYYKPGSDDGLTLAGAPTCVEHVATRFEDDSDLADDGVRRSATIELARWLVKHSVASTRWLGVWARVTDGLREVYACLRRHDGHFDEEMLHIMICQAETEIGG